MNYEIEELELENKVKALMQANNSESRTDIDELLLSLEKDAAKCKYTI